MRLLFKLLRRNLNLWQMLGFALANLLGAVIVLFGIQAYRDLDTVFDAEDSFISSNYLVLSKPVSVLSTVTSALGAHSGFSEEEIHELEQQPGVTRVGRFQAAQFNVYGSVDIGGTQMTSAMFLESVPDEFLDFQGDMDRTWKATLEGEFIPMVIPQSYLNLYNYGFATSRGMPQMGENLLSRFTLVLTLYGQGEVHHYRARVVALSNRLNTILVPEGFLTEANERMGRKDKSSLPSRLIVATQTSDASSELLNYIEENDYAIEDNADEKLRMQTFVHGILWAVVALGLVVSVLAFFLLLISILLLIEKNREKLSTLHAIGYELSRIAKPYQLMAVALDVFVWFFAALVVMAVYPLFSRFLSGVIPGFEPNSIALIWIVAFLFTLIFSLLHLVVIYRNVWKIRSANAK
ncbi:MAG: hypothetical protein J5543_08505 [Bacteroidales bacterium]|nr:hypothetical protein [Bacteroidales bacterium]